MDSIAGLQEVVEFRKLLKVLRETDIIERKRERMTENALGPADHVTGL